ncbi:hypothetical protein Barb7_01939 [Bacteroidales bacterium Barb7]|nr:hypothetical protein Barb7_01939 [Bacteroidales bacterium Barb7]
MDNMIHNDIWKMLIIRNILPSELPVLEDMLYEAIFQPEGAEQLP